MAGRQSAEDALDYFPTPPWAARAGGELIKRLDPSATSCWEPAAGGGHMVHGLKDYFPVIVASDVTDYGAGFAAVDFLDPAWNGAPYDWIVTNPPFNLAEAFTRTAFARARRGVAMLCRLAFLEGGARHKLLHVDCPLTICAPFSERVPMVKGRWDPSASSATAYAWFLWFKGWKGSPTIWPIPPGTRARLTDPYDARRYGVAAETPLLDGAAP